MSIRKLGVIAAGITVAIVGTASTATNFQILREGRAYNRMVCSAQVAPGMAHCHARVITDARGDELNGKPNASRLVAPSGLSPADLHSAYSLGGFPSSSTVPNGPLVAIVDAYGYKNAEADLAVYRAQYGLPACTTANGCFKKVDQTGHANFPRDNTGWSQEAALDLDMVSAACPNCRIMLVQGSSSSIDNLGTAVNTAVRLGALVVSNSYGGSEFSSEATYETKYYKHPGVAVTVSSGDNGYGVEFPASSQYVTAVGGTSLVRGGTGWTETVWNGAGSGCSAYITKPSWQTDTGCANRTVADVSAVADPNTGVAVYGPTSRRGSGWMVFGGTSVAAPIIAGIYGLSGNASNYGSDPYANSSALKDIVSGTNGTCSTYLCKGVVGYDGPTGLGTPTGTTAF